MGLDTVKVGQCKSVYWTETGVKLPSSFKDWFWRKFINGSGRNSKSEKVQLVQFWSMGTQLNWMLHGV